ncbi:hypothetical protein V6N11_000822 [Hibiscus sabdariffa]|uniref:Uncharacterized protein n=1 Tax=Hibiscus sabdariffa TaxID=183260 RepID=A0ABR2RXW2_9ROSI
MDIEQVKRHTCSDRHVHNALLNRALDAEVIEYNGTLRKVRSVSNVVLSFMKPEDRIEDEQKLKKKGCGRPMNNQKSQVGNKEEIVKDIAHIIEARGHAL